MIDYNCFCGNWPFHKVRKNKFSDICKLHKENGIECGYISSLESIFYNDCYEAELDLYNEIKGSGYNQVITLNPTLDTCMQTLKRCVEELDVKGVRLAPGFHDYNINDECVNELLDKMKELKLPLFITVRYEDDRVLYLMKPEAVKTEDIEAFILKNPELEIIICNIGYKDVLKIKETILSRDNVTFDISGFRTKVFAMPELRKEGLGHKARYGSMAPLFCMKSSVLIFNEPD